MELPRDPKFWIVLVVVVLFVYSFLTGQTCSLGAVPACQMPSQAQEQQAGNATLAEWGLAP